jgi:ribosome-binding protein aMBF1 (putative translation factor)
MNVADGIRAAREAKGLTHAQLARACRVNVVSVRRWERGIHEPYMTNRADLERVLGIRFVRTMSVLVGQEEA